MHRVVSDYTRTDTGSSNISVFVRARPVEDDGELADFLQIDPEDDRKIVIKDPEASNRRYGEVNFQFDNVFWTKASQEDIFNTSCKVNVDHVLSGYNSCCFAYGQTGSGKTYTMFGNDGDVRGIIPRSVEYLFSSLAKKTSTSEVAMVCSFLEIYNDQIRDLGKAYLVAMGVESSSSQALFEKTSDIYENIAGKRGNPYFAPAFHRAGTAMANSDRPGLKEVQDEYNTMNYEIREDNEGNVFVKDLSLVPVTTMEEVMSLISMGLRVRATHETKMNSTSSRSHTVFTITVLQRDKSTGQSITGMLNLVDLAGSERLKKSESQGIRLKEALHINTSLTCLGKVVMALDQNKETSHIPFRDSKLTRVLQNSLGGNSYTSVIATLHPNGNYYEECLSTLQFANRCRNVRNNPRVNYVEDTEDKDRKIRKLTEELNLLRNKMTSGGGFEGGGRGGGGDEKLSASKLVAILKRLGINATTAPDGTLLINGKKFALDELGVGGSVSDSTGEGGMRMSKDGAGGPSNEKLQKQLKELKEINANHSSKAKERKSQMEEQGRDIQKLTSELVKCQTTIKHQEFEYKTLFDEKERAIKELRTYMEHRHADELKAIIDNNKSILVMQQKEIERIPTALKDYTALMSKTEKQKMAFQQPLRQEFEDHLAQLDKNRLVELDRVKKQYEYWLTEKDKALSGFVDSFNLYRTKKSEQLRMAEREIVRLYDYTEQIETILDNVEKGKYSVKQKQGYRGGRSTTGVMATGIADGGGVTGGGGHRPKTSSSVGSAGGGGGGNVGEHDSEHTGVFGAVQLPTGLRPPNPLKTTISNKELELTKKIVAKHKERVRKLDEMKEEAFQKSLHYAAQTGATAAGVVDPSIQKQIRDLLGRHHPESNTRSGSPKANKSAGSPLRPISGGPSSPTNGLPTAQLAAGGGGGVGGSGVFKHPSAVRTSSEAKALSATVSPENSVISSGSAHRQHLQTAPGSLQRNSSAPQDDFIQVDLPPRSPGQHSVSINQMSNDVIMELEYLREKNKMEQLTTRKVMDELASNETILYIQKLEEESKQLKKQLKEAAAQLHTTMVANAALTRKMNTASSTFLDSVTERK